MKNWTQKLIALFIIGLVSAVTLSCGIGLEDSIGPNPDRIIKNEKNKREFELIKGVYVGRAENAQSGLESFPAKLSIYYEEIQKGDDSDMQPAGQIVLRARFQRLDFVGDSDNLILTGRFDASSGTVNFTPPGSQGAGSGAGAGNGAGAGAGAGLVEGAGQCDIESKVPISIRGTISGETANLVVNRDGRTWAYFDAELKTRTVNADPITDGEANLERLRETYRQVQGTYKGSLTRSTASGSSSTENVIFSMMVVEMSQGTDSRGQPCLKPMLNGRFLREKSSDYDDVTFYNVRYYPDKNELTATFPGDSTRGQFQLRAAVASTVGEPAIEGRFYTTDGIWGELKTSRVSKDPVTSGEDDDQIERERLMRTYNEVIGKYVGKVDPEDHTTPWPVELTISIVEAEVGTKPGGRPKIMPALRARYRRPDFTPGVGERFLKVSYTVEGGLKRLSMVNIGAVPSPIPGGGTMSITADYNDQTKTIKGQIGDQRGSLGTISLKRK